MSCRRFPALAVAIVFFVSGPEILAQRDNEKNQPKRSKQEQADIDTLVKLVDDVSRGQQPAPAEFAVMWDSNHFMKSGDGLTYIPINLTIDRGKLSSPAVAMYIRVTDKAQAAAPAPAATDKDKEKNQAPPPATYPWASISFTDIPADGKLSRSIALPPGSYEAFIAFKEKGTDQKNAPPAKMSLVRSDLTVPDFTSGLSTSSILLAKSVEQAAGGGKQEENPYTFGPMKVVPNLEGKFAQSTELQLIYWIYGASAAPGGDKPDVQVEYSFHQRLPEGEKYFNKTAPQMLNAKACTSPDDRAKQLCETVPAEFSVAAGHQLTGSLVVPLASFTPGDYRLEIKITDNASGKSLTQNVNFTVLA